MFLPIVALTFSSLYLPQHINNILVETMGTAKRDIETVNDLQISVLEAGNAPHDYMLYGRQGEREQFTRLSQDIERGLRTIQDLMTSSEEQQWVAYARAEWQQILNISTSILGLSDPTLDSAMQEQIENLHLHIDSMLYFLRQLQVIARGESFEVERKAIDIIENTLPTAAVIVGVAIVIAVGAILLLLYSVLTPIRLLKEGAAHFARGDLFHRVPVVSGDELGELAKAFNAMAESLEKSEIALEDLATHDGLTGLYNSREFHRLLQAEIERSQRYKHPVSLLIGDIDRFKKVNDTYGHQAGDTVLRAVADHMQESVRKVDFVARYGGEEFAIILPEMTAADAVVVAERIRKSIAATTITLQEAQTVTIAISIGVAAFPENANSENTLVAAADQALYAAKAAGRNRVSRAS